ncbi:MAG TPA: hypothetical protein PLA54_12110 [Spirochaetota bacterium]|nr:hypothetical protein [Spirochaetota bacterium]HQE59922.1 hypothetical protein [Spirochaetota bacterium]
MNISPIFYYFTYFILFITLFGCGDSSEQEISVYQRKENEFWAADTQTRKYYILTAPVFKEGQYCTIRIEESCLSLLNYSTVDHIISEFDNTIYPLIKSKFGDESDIDGNGKIIILILDIKDNYSGSGSYIAGYFDSSNTFVNSDYHPHSNECDMIYLDCNPGIPGTNEFLITTAHEFQHLINFAHNGMTNGKIQDTWINEGLSSAAEYLYSGSHITKRLNYYNIFQDNDSSGNNFYKWGNELIDYSTVYLFFQWLRIQSSDGDIIYKDILNSSYTDYRAVTEQIEKHIPYYNGIPINSTSWTNIMINWLIANQINKSNGILGYKGNITGLSQMQSNSGITNLYPFEAVMRNNNGNYYPSESGSNIIYRGITADGTITSTSAPYNGDFILAINNNPLQYGKSEKAELPYSISPLKKILTKNTLVESSFRTGIILGAPGSENSLDNYNNQKNEIAGESINE